MLLSSRPTRVRGRRSTETRGRVQRVLVESSWLHLLRGSQIHSYVRLHEHRGPHCYREMGLFCAASQDRWLRETTQREDASGVGLASATRGIALPVGQRQGKNPTRSKERKTTLGDNIVVIHLTLMISYTSVSSE